MAVNESQKTVLFEPMRAHFGGDLTGVKVALWGLAFKPETDDIREAPSLYMIDKLLEAGAEIVAFDPEAMDNVKARIGDRIGYRKRAMDAVEGADCLLICTEWAAFRTPDFDALAEKMNAKVIFDGRNLYETSKLAKLGWTYRSIGRPTMEAQP